MQRPDSSGRHASKQQQQQQPRSNRIMHPAALSQIEVISPCSSYGCHSLKMQGL
jgi:hypothetical protein